MSDRVAGLLRSRLSGWCRVEDGDGPGLRRVTMPSAASAARELAAFGDEVDVRGPPEVIAEPAGLGARLLRRYGTAG